MATKVFAVNLVIQRGSYIDRERLLEHLRQYGEAEYMRAPAGTVKIRYAAEPCHFNYEHIEEGISMYTDGYLQFTRPRTETRTKGVVAE